jgi:hypothetical protein
MTRDEQATRQKLLNIQKVAEVTNPTDQTQVHKAINAIQLHLSALIHLHQTRKPPIPNPAD